MGLFSRKKLIEPPQPDPNLKAILARLEAISARDEPSTDPEPSLVARIEDVEARMEVFQERVKGYMRTISGQVSKAKQMGASLNDPFEQEEEQTEPVAADVEGNGPRRCRSHLFLICALSRKLSDEVVGFPYRRYLCLIFRLI